MGEIRNGEGILNQVMVLYELLPAEVKNISETSSLPDWLKKVGPAMEEKLVMAGIILSPGERKNLDLRLKKEFVKQTGGMQSGEMTVESL
ncbi:MAG: hypothetical protein WA057_01965 [Candidatus Magasanikiibacteriota bacterium]